MKSADGVGSSTEPATVKRQTRAYLSAPTARQQTMGSMEVMAQQIIDAWCGRDFNLLVVC